MKKLTSLMLALMLALALLTGCGSNTQETVEAIAAPEVTAAPEATETPDAAEATAAPEEEAQDEKTITVTFSVTDAEGNVTPFELTAQEGATLADALLDAGLISQEEHDAGFVTVVNGIEANWDDGQAWWCLVDGQGEMTSVGISEITLAQGDAYGFVYTQGQ